MGCGRTEITARFQDDGVSSFFLRDLAHEFPVSELPTRTISIGGLEVGMPLAEAFLKIFVSDNMNEIHF